MTNPTTPPDLEAQGAELIAYGSTEHGGAGPRAQARPRWTELSVWYLHNPGPGGKRWVSQSAGMTRISGEQERITRLPSGTLERALKLIDQNGELGVAVAETAREWAEDNRVTVENGRSGRLEFENDEAALTWLYGQPDQGHKGFASMLAKDMGIGESTARMQMANKRAVMVPLRSLLPFVDRAAFRRAREEAARG